MKDRGFARQRETRGILWVSLFLAVVFWVALSILHSLIFPTGPFTEKLLHPGFAETLVRLLVIGILVGFGIYAQREIRRRALREADLSAREEHFRGFAEACFEGLAIHDGERILEANDTFAGMFGHSLDSVQGMNLRFLFSPQAFEIIQRRAREDLNAPCEVQCVRSDGSALVAEIQGKTIDYCGAPARVMALRDVTARKRTESQHVQTQKMETAGILAGGVAHEFNNLLTSISGYSELLLDYLGDEDPLRKDVEEIREAGRRALSLTRRLLAFSHRHLLRPGLSDVNALLRDASMTAEAENGDRIVVKTELDPAVHPVRAEAENLRQAFLHLVKNAREAMPDGGTLTLATENVVLDEAACRTMSESRPGPFVRVRIRDTGVGMKEEVLGHALEPFFTTQEFSKGKGLGLPSAYGIIRQHDGWMTIESRPGAGTTVEIYLPYAAEEMAAAVPADEPFVEVQGNGERILVVEDDEGVRSLGTRVLRESGYVVREAASAAEALEAFSREEEGFDLLFSDVVLPDRSGIELAEHLRARRSDLRILLTSGYTDEEGRFPEIRRRGWPFLPKPYRLSQLQRLVRDALYSEAARSEERESRRDA